jgi:hypothetical protein
MKGCRQPNVRLLQCCQAQLMRFETGGDMGGKWVAVGGSGKYEGMTASATYAPVGEIPPGAAPGIYNKCNRNTGTYRLK